MDWVIIGLAAATLLALALLMSGILGWAKDAFHVVLDPRVEQINAALPGANCGGCGCIGCGEYAEAVLTGTLPPDRCPVGGSPLAKTLAGILGIDLATSWPRRPAVHCGATYGKRKGRGLYDGEKTCAAANLIAGVQGCTYGCLGFGDCQRACAFAAIHVIDGLATVEYDKCVGCGACEIACPRHIISMVPFKVSRMLVIKCSNHDSGKDVKAVCEVGCIGCCICTRNAGELFVMEGNLPRIDYDHYDPGKMDAADIVITKCPMKRIEFIGKPSAKDLEATRDEDMPALVKDDFRTTVDQTDWQG